ncbi:MAG: hypothetical protein JRF63_05635 [Deltaproteobacteria bacterium]|nr:hypothetical protein [Deltaproteobacteria bacterium]
MANPTTMKSPLLGYNTNVRHAGQLFHVQTEDSGRDRPHIITHLFTSGTILATKKTAYDHVLGEPDWEDQVQQMMKDQHKTMFVELRDGVHDEIASQILGVQLNEEHDDEVPTEEEAPPPAEPLSTGEVQVIRPAEMIDEMKHGAKVEHVTSEDQGRSIFETPDVDGRFGESLISDKSLDEVILDYLKDDLD